jgi:glutaconyl-CoA/methylmalonyl-CoA decarboxylase subunit gamma
MRKLRITVDGRAYNVIVEELSESGETHDRERAAPAHNGAAAAPAPPPPAPANPSAAGPEAAAGPGSVVAPLGGTVQAIVVTPGSVIAVGDEVAIIEAMKMKNVVRSHVAGKVASIAVAANQSVETGQVLMIVT